MGGLLIPKTPDWSFCTDNYPATLSGLTMGASITPGVSDADGAVVDLFGSPISHHTEYLQLKFSYQSPPAAGDNSMLATVLYDPDGGTNWQTLIPFLIVSAGELGLSTTNTPAVYPLQYDFPIAIPAGSTIGIRARCAHTSVGDLRCIAIAQGGNANPEAWWLGQRVSAIGINAAASQGTSHTPGSTNVFSSWTDFGSPLAESAKAFQFAVSGVFGSATYFASTYLFEFGVAGQRIGPPVIKGITSAEVGCSVSTGLVWKELRAGTQLQVRAKCNTGALNLGVGAYAIH